MPVCAPHERHGAGVQGHPSICRYPVIRDRENVRDLLPGRGIQYIPSTTRSVSQVGYYERQAPDLHSPACFPMVTFPERPFRGHMGGLVALPREEGCEVGRREGAMRGGCCY